MEYSNSSEISQIQFNFLDGSTWLVQGSLGSWKSDDFFLLLQFLADKTWKDGPEPMQKWVEPEFFLATSRGRLLQLEKKSDCAEVYKKMNQLLIW